MESASLTQWHGLKRINYTCIHVGTISDLQGGEDEPRVILLGDGVSQVDAGADDAEAARQVQCLQHEYLYSICRYPCPFSFILAKLVVLYSNAV